MFSILVIILNIKICQFITASYLVLTGIFTLFLDNAVTLEKVLQPSNLHTIVLVL